MKKKIGIVSLGCPKNLVDSEIMLGLLKKEAYEITHEQEEAHIIIVNTCGFIDSAKQESIQTILEMSVNKEKNCELLIVTGCLAERYKDEIFKEIPEVDAVVGTGSYGEIHKVIETAYEGRKIGLYGKLQEIAYLENTRMLTQQNGYAYLKIAEGCDNCCTYCIIPSLRGKYRSRKLEDLSREAKDLEKQGVKEIILVAQDVTRYGQDLYQENKLVELIQELSELEGIEWIRLLYCYPEEIDDALISELATNNKLCKYLDIPIQHASDKILKKMGRRGSKRELSEILKKLKQKVPDIILRTSIIVGFPGEEEEDYQELRSFIEKQKFDRLGVFSYSKEEDTPAAKLKGQTSKRIKEKRHKELMLLQQKILYKKQNKRIKKTYKTLVEGISEDGIFFKGRTYGEAPEIDPVVFFTSREPLTVGEIVNVKILNTDQYDLIGEVEYESSK